MKNLRISACTLVMAAAITAQSSTFAQECINIAIDDSTGQKQSLDPAFQTSFDDSIMLLLVYNRLVGVSDSLDPIPEVAESWEPSADGTSWIYHIRKGIKFHDGTDLNAHDVAFTFQRLVDPDVGSPASGELNFLKDATIEAVDDYTVRFAIGQPISEFPRLMGSKFNLIVPEGSNHDQLRTHGVGSGPFTQEEFTPGGPQRIFRRNADYWKDGLPKAECIRITVIQEALTALAAIKSGEVDLLPAVSPVAVATLRDDPAVQLVETSAANSMSLTIQTDVAPFDDVRVRKALKLVVDRQAMIDVVMLGFAELGNDNPIPPNWPSAYVHEVPDRDVAAAIQLLSEAGYPDEIDIDLFTAEAQPGMTQFAQVYAEMAKEANIRVNVVVTPSESYWEEVWLNRPLFVSGWAPRPPLAALTHAYTRASQWNETHWFRDDYEALLKQAAIEFDAAKRDDLLGQAQEMLTEEGGLVTPFFVHTVSALRSGCSGFRPHPQNYSLNFENLACN